MHLRCLWVLLAASLAIWAGDPFVGLPPMRYGFRSYGIDQGLTTPSVTAMAQDLEGFLWAGTEDGLFRLEGERYRRFDPDDGLPGAGILALSHAIPRGLWISTGRGAAWWDGQTFHRPSALGIPNIDDRPGMPVTGGGMILSHFEAKKRWFSLGGPNFRELIALPWGDGASCAFYDAPRARLVVALGNEFYVQEGTHWRGRKMPPGPAHYIRALLVDGSGRYWLRMAERLYRLDALDGPLVEVPIPLPLSFVNNCYLAQDGFGRVWTNTASSLVWLHQNQSGTFGLAQGLPTGGALVLLSDHQGTLWVGGDGIHKLQGDSLWSAATPREGLPSDVVWSVCRTRDGRVWAGTAGGLAFGTPAGWQVVPGTGGCQIMSLFEDASGVLWVGHQLGGTRQTGLMRVLPGAREAQTVTLAGVSPQGGIYSMAAAEDGRLWVGANPGGLLRVTPGRPNPGAPRVEAQAVQIPGWPEQHLPKKLAPDGQGGLWVAGTEGLAHWGGGAWAVLPPKALPEKDLITVASLSPTEAWIAPQSSKALVRVQREGNTLRVVQTLQGAHPLTQALAVAMARDAAGVLWLATARGLLRWEGDTVEKYGRNAGLPGEDCAQNALWLDPGGDVWVGLSVGIARGAVAQRRAPQGTPRAAILRIQDGQGRGLDSSGAAEVPWSARTLTFHHASAGSLWTEGCTFQVRLVGLEDGWRDTTLPEARYPNLGPGAYRYEVRAVSPTLVPGEPATFAFQVLPPWWLRWWALLLGLFLVGSLALLAYRWRTALLRRRNQLLEELVHARTAELEKANLALEEASLVDPLTGLRNRRYLSVTMPEEQVRLRRVFRTYLDRGENPMGRNEDLVMLLLDLDHFKAVNDTHGHASGDAVLQQTAAVLRAVSRTSDTQVRWGGEEFLLVAKRTDRLRAHLIAANICRAIREHPFTLPDGHTIRCTGSIGFASFPIFQEQPEDLGWEDTLQVADQCLYIAKRSGRDGYVGVHTPGPMDPGALGSRLRFDLEALIREDQVVVRSSFEHLDLAGV